MSIEFWLILGVALLIIEFLLPGLILLFFGIGALAVAATTALGLTPGPGSQWTLFAVVSVLALIGLRRAFRAWFQGRVEDLDERASGEIDSALGELAEVTRAFADGHGEVRFNGTRWQALWRGRGAPPGVGGHVRIRDRDGIRFIVGAVSPEAAAAGTADR